MGAQEVIPKGKGLGQRIPRALVPPRPQISTIPSRAKNHVLNIVVCVPGSRVYRPGKHFSERSYTGTDTSRPSRPCHSLDKTTVSAGLGVPAPVCS